MNIWRERDGARRERTANYRSECVGRWCQPLQKERDLADNVARRQRDHVMYHPTTPTSATGSGQQQPKTQRHPPKQYTPVKLSSSLVSIDMMVHRPSWSLSLSPCISNARRVPRCCKRFFGTLCKPTSISPCQFSQSLLLRVVP